MKSTKLKFTEMIRERENREGHNKGGREREEDR